MYSNFVINEVNLFYMRWSKNALNRLVHTLHSMADLDAVYVFGSTASGETHPESDLDLGILFHEHIGYSLKAHMRVQFLKQELEKQFSKLDIIDLELAPPALQYAIIRGNQMSNRNSTRIHRLENAILSRIEETFE